MYTRLGDFFFLKHFINGVEWVSKTNNIFFFFYQIPPVIALIATVLLGMTIGSVNIMTKWVKYHMRLCCPLR